MSLDIKAQDEENRLAVKEVQEYIHNVTSAHTMISMKSILDSFSRPPYGYQETDTKWMVAKLFKEGIISATVDKEPVTSRHADMMRKSCSAQNRRLISRRSRQ